MRETQSSASRMFWTLHLSGWAAFGLGMALSRVGRYPIDYMIATKAALAILGALFSLALRPLYRRMLGDDAPLVRMLAVTVIASFVMAQPWTAAYNLIDARIGTTLLHRRIEIHNATELFAASFYHTFAMLAWSVLYVGIKRHIALLAARERALRAEAMANQARLQALRFQIQPHFLFNTLNALSTLIVERKSDEASQMLSRLSDFLRYTLSGPTTDVVSLREELSFARRYLDIEQVRLMDRLTVKLDTTDDALDALVPTLILQPLLENAIRHGVARFVGGGVIHLEARRRDDTLVLAIQNDAAITDGDAKSNGTGAEGVGLPNTRARLEQLYGNRQTFRSGARPPAGFRVEIELPYTRA